MKKLLIGGIVDSVWVDDETVKTHFLFSKTETCDLIHYQQVELCTEDIEFLPECLQKLSLENRILFSSKFKQFQQNGINHFEKECMSALCNLIYKLNSKALKLNSSADADELLEQVLMSFPTLTPSQIEERFSPLELFRYTRVRPDR